MHITWLDLIAANIIAVLWLWGVLNALRWVRTEKSKFIPGFILVVFVGFGLILCISRAAIWFAEMDDDVIVPEVAAKP